MTNDEIMAIANAVYDPNMWSAPSRVRILDFARKIAAVEREACAVECEKYASNTTHQDVAEAIRSRK